MAYITGSVTDGFGVLPFSLSASTQLSMSIQNSLPGVSYYGLETVPDGNGFYNPTTATNLSGSFILGSGIVDVVYDNYKMVAAVAPGGGTLTYTPAVAVEADTLRTRGTGASLGRVDFDTLVASSYSKRVTTAGGYVESPDSITAAIAATPILKDASFLFLPSGYSSGTAFSELSTNDYGDLTWTRGSDAFRTNASGLIQRVPWNLVRFSEDLTNAAWVSDGTATVTANATTAPDGNLTADRLQLSNSMRRYIYQTITPSQTTYTYSIYLRANSNQSVRIGVDQTCTNYRGALICNVTNEWQRFTLTLSNISIGTVLAISIDNITSNITQCTGTGSNVDLFVWGAQLVEGTTAQTYLPTTDRLNFPRLSYMYGSSPSVLLEPQRTNLFVNSGWTGGGATPTSWSSFITGTTTAVTSIKNISISAYRFSATNQRAFFAQSLTTTIGTTYSVSFYCESITTTQSIQDTISGGTPVAYYKNGVSISSTANLEAGNFYTYTLLAAIVTTDIRIGVGVAANITANIILSMPQFEQGAYSTTFILSPVGATATRVVDSFSRGNIFTNGLITSSGGTWFLELRNNVAYVADAPGDAIILGVTQATSDNCFRFASGTVLERVVILKRISGASTTLFTTTTSTVKIAIKWNGTTADVFVNGTKVVSATSFSETAMQWLHTNIQVPRFIQQMALYSQPLAGVDMGVLTGASYYPSFLNMAQALNYTIA